MSNHYELFNVLNPSLECTNCVLIGLLLCFIIEATLETAELLHLEAIQLIFDFLVGFFIECKIDSSR